MCVIVVGTLSNIGSNDGHLWTNSGEESIKVTFIHSTPFDDEMVRAFVFYFIYEWKRNVQIADLHLMIIPTEGRKRHHRAGRVCVCKVV